MRQQENTEVKGMIDPTHTGNVGEPQLGFNMEETQTHTALFENSRSRMIHTV